LAIGALEFGEVDRRILAGEQSSAKTVLFLDNPVAIAIAAEREV
jgi:hypothetical protein